MTTPRLRHLVLTACVLATLALAVAAPVFADEGEQAEPKEKALTQEELEQRLFENPKTALLAGLLRFGPVLLGIVFAILWYLRWDKIRGGMLPPPPRVEPTVPFDLGSTLVLVGAGVLAMFLVSTMLAVQGGWTKPEDIPVWAGIATTGAGMVPIAALVVLRRRRMAATGAEERPAGGGLFAPPPGRVDPAPGALRAFLLGGWGVCIASLVVLPVALGWVALLEVLGTEAETQVLVQRAVEDPEPVTAWLVAGFGVLVAPFTEECIFRGMLYPAIRNALGGNRRAVWISAVIVSAAFAMVHDAWAARIPLFALAMVMTWIFEKTNSLAGVIWLHAFFNLLSVVPLLLIRSVL